jgi:hypothetical protein
MQLQDTAVERRAEAALMSSFPVLVDDGESEILVRSVEGRRQQEGVSERSSWRETAEHVRSGGEEEGASIVVALLLDDAVLRRLGLVNEIGVCER